MKIRGWGRLLSIGSVQERRPHPEMLPYSSLKHAQTGLVLGLAKPLGPFGITANNLAPGVILTDRNSEALGNPDYAEQVQRAIPAKRFGQPSDCAGAALLLCSEAGAYITGQSLYVDGGLGLP
jgi:NAD(P)-dependent dehydrogenase (short-subunit alcohol dehydrogenase family)